MAAVVDLSEALFSSLRAIWTADSGADGLSNSSSTAYVRQFVLEGDPNYDDDRQNYQWPRIRVAIEENPEPVFGLTGTARVRAIVRMKVQTLRDAGRTIQNAINSRVDAQYDMATPASVSPWSFSPLTDMGGLSQLASSKTEYNYEHVFEVRCSGA